MAKTFSILFLLIIQCIPFPSWSSYDGPDHRIKSIGLPFITNYGQADYDFSAHNFDVIVGDDQKIYFANHQGILVYDGINWTRLRLPKEMPAYAFAKWKDGTIFVGAMNDFGYLSASESGNLTYVSLKNQLPDDELGTFTVRIQTVGNKIIGTINDKCILIDPETKKTSILNNPKDVTSIQAVNGKLYAFSNDKLYQFQNGQWQFERESHIMENTKIGRGHLIQIAENKTIAITQNGFFDFESGDQIAINKDVEKLLSQTTIYRVNILKENYIAICTWSGLLITDQKGNPIQFIDKEKGLPDNYLYRVALDKQGMLWVAMYNGISKIDLFSAYSILDKRLSVEGVIKDVQLHKDYLYYSSIPGVFRENWQDLMYPFFKPDFDQVSNAVCHQMINTREDLFVFTERQNNLVLKNKRFEEINGTKDKIYWAGFKYKKSDDLLLASHDGFLVHAIKKKDKWVIRKQIDPLFQSVYFLVEGKGNTIWLSDVGEGIFKMNYDIEKAELLDDKNYGAVDGLPSDKNNYVYEIDSKPCFTTEKGIYRYNESTDKFIPDERFAEIIGEEPISMISEDENGNLYYFSDEFVMIRNTTEGYEKVRLPSMDFKKYPPSDLTVINHENIFISSLNAMAHVNPTMRPIAKEFEVSIAKLSTINSDSVLYGGFGTINENLNLEPNNNALRFEFSSTFHKGADQTLYKWRLKGMEELWSDWSKAHTKDYTNLPHGAFEFEIIAKNVYGKESAPASIKFSIAAPWYLTFWAYAIYVFLLFAFIWLLVVWNSRRLVAKNKKLEKIITERTAEITQQRNKLLQMDDLKKRFFVNISHELRTPLTLSMGTVDQAIKGAYGQLNDSLYANLKVSKRNSERLLKMVNSILDISKLEGGRIQLFAEAVDPAIILEKVLAFFSSRLADKRIKLEERFSPGLELYLDRDKFETILINLVSNAFKFTEDGGTIFVEMIEHDNEVVVLVRDTGKGIPNQDLTLVFDRFYQSPSVKSGEGMGVGLALTKELVELHHGSIKAQNQNGAVFTMKFPKGRNHLSPNQIAEHDESRPVTSMQDKYPLHDDMPSCVVPPSQENHSLHLLIVEDNPEMRRFISSILSPHYRISEVGDGMEAISFLKNEVPDLIVTDYLMPNMDGYEMALEIKKSDDWAFIPMVFLTARAREQDKLNVLNLGVDDYIFKPFSSDELLIRIKNLLNTKKQRTDFVTEESIDPRDIEWKEFPSKLKLDIDEFIKNHIKEDISGEDLSEHTGQSERSLYRKVKVNTGLSLKQYVKEYRLRTARTILENRETQTVSEVAYAIGFNYLSHFTKNYKERFGRQPSDYLD